MPTYGDHQLYPSQYGAFMNQFWPTLFRLPCGLTHMDDLHNQSCGYGSKVRTSMD
jgi:hypothetical protein